MDGSDCRGYRTTRRNLPSSIAYRPPFTAISRNIGVIDMQ
ncbi:biotin transporter BioY, partial [Escherichia coli]|nr:biotin transporter BioY [Escherichia coli]